MKTDRNDERRKRIKDIALTGAGLAFGAYALKESGSLKSISKVLGDFSKASSSTLKDLSEHSFRELDYSTLNKIAKKNFLEEDSVWNLARKDNGITLDYGNGLLSSILELNKIKTGTTYVKDEMFNSYQKNYIVDELNKSLKKENNEFIKQLRKLTDKVMDNQNQFFEYTDDFAIKTIDKQFSKEIEGTLLEEDKHKIVSVIEQAINDSEARRESFYGEFDNEIKNQISDKFTEELKNQYNPENHKDRFFKDTLDRAATINDLIENYDNGNIKINNIEVPQLGDRNIIDYLKELTEADSDFGNLVIDNATLRVNKNNELYSIKDLNDIINQTKEGYSDTILGKLFFGRSFTDIEKAPDFFYLPKGTYDPILAKLNGAESGILNDNFFKLGNSFYKLNTENVLEKFNAADDLYLMGGTHGSLNVLNNRIQGNIYEKKASNKLFEDLDINTSGVNLFETIKGKINKFNDKSSWKRNSANRLFNLDNYKPGNNYDEFEFLNDIKAINSLYNSRTFKPTEHLFNELQKVVTSDANILIKAAKSDNPAQYLLERYHTDYINLDLQSLINKMSKNISDVKNTAQIGSLGKTEGVNVLNYNDLIKREIFKEIMLLDSRNTKSEVKGFATSLSKLEKLNINGAEKNNAINLFNWSILQKVSELYSSTSHSIRTHEQLLNTKTAMSNMLTKQTEKSEQINYFLEQFRNNVFNFAKDNTSITDTVLDSVKTVEKGYKNNKWVTMRKAINPLDIIKNLNDNIKAADTTKSFIKQFYAGRNNTNDITTASFIPYHLVNRLVTPLETVGLGFSNKNTGSVGDLTKNFILKRILPAAGAVYALSYLNFESENLTGKSLTQDFYSFTSSFGLGIKTIQQGFGLDTSLRTSRMYNPIANYWLGDYKDKDEYIDYLNNGYDPVRKGRWWNFGSASEFRGGKISYWKPNNFRLSYSHFRDVSLYGSEDEKWKHSWIPTPRHPLAPLRRALDPYWLERKHYWDRPYPVTGDLFPAETPWGAILNPTIGQLIKPRRRMHQKELQGTLVDVRSIIEKKNKEIFEKSQANRLALVDKSGISPLEYSPTSMPSMNEAIYSININNGKITSKGFSGEKFVEELSPLSSPNVPLINNINSKNNNYNSNNNIGTSLYSITEKDNRLNEIARTLITGIQDMAIGKKKSNDVSMNIINQINTNIKNQGKANEYNQDGIFIEKAKLYTKPYNAKADNLEDKYLDKLNINSVNSKNEYVSNMMYSVKELTGMYGFLFESILPNSHGYKLAQAGRMNSFVRNYWDASFGGHGGDVMEIARRFFPHQNHDIEEINPIRNTMPLWLPERFQTGDPYTKLPLGEARLPGKGYETLNKLHPDSYGRYGAFDRYKILADVSPGSDEYKIWKKITKQEYKNNPEILKQITQIEKRVTEQSKEHDFYDYQFIGKKLNTQKAAINKVNGDGTFTIIGSNEVYQLAGVKPNKNPLTKKSYIYDYLKPGMVVSLQYDSNKYNRINSNGNISAIVKFDGTNISKQLYEEKKAEINSTQETLADKRFASTSLTEITGPLFELIGHAQIPYIHNKYLRIDSPMESYKKDQIYGTTYSTWAHPIKGYIQPTFQSSFARSPIWQAAGMGAWYLSEKATKEGWKTLGKGGISHALFAFTNPGALAGGILGYIPKMNLANHSSKIWNARNGSRIGATAGIIGYGLANLNNPILSAANFSIAGMLAADQLKYVTKSGERILGSKGALIGAAAGLTLSALKNPSLKNISSTYIPKDTKKKWEIEEYYDRLEYIKYTNLYKKAARLAKRKEGIDVNKIINRFEYERDQNKKDTDLLSMEKDFINKLRISKNTKKNLTSLIDFKLNSLEIPEQYFKTGKYTKAALAYKKAADTTIYGLSNYSTNADVLRALPKYDRDYFIEFSKEKDPKEREKILKYISPYKKKALQIMWGEKADKLENNDKFFSTHKLPNLFWAGWNPQENLDNVKIKTIKNEGMLLSDFGIYDSQSKTQDAINAPEIKDINNNSSALSLKANLLSLLNGIGLSSVDVSVETSMSSGIQIITNLKRVGEYNLQQKISNIFNNI